MRAALGDDATADQIETLKRHTFYGREKDNLIYPIALANMVLHGIEEPRLWHGNTLTGSETYGGLFQGAPALFDVVLTNPPFGGKEGKEAQTRFAYKTRATQVLFLEHVIDNLKPGGHCGIVLRAYWPAALPANYLDEVYSAARWPRSGKLDRLVKVAESLYGAIVEASEEAYLHCKIPLHDVTLFLRGPTGPLRSGGVDRHAAGRACARTPARVQT